MKTRTTATVGSVQTFDSPENVYVIAQNGRRVTVKRYCEWEDTSPEFAYVGSAQEAKRLAEAFQVNVWATRSQADGSLVSVRAFA